MTRRNVVITAPDVTEAGYSGMGLRALGLAGALAARHDVTVLAAGYPSILPSTGVKISADMGDYLPTLAQADVVITSNAVRLRHRFGLRAALVSDLYDPSYFEWLILDNAERTARRPWMSHQLRALRQSLRTSDLVLCANSRQRDLYLGGLLGASSLTRLLSQDDRGMRDRVLAIPNGIVITEGMPSRTEARQRLGFAPDDVVFLWGGGVWDWLDPELVLNAVHEAHRTDPRIRLVFLGLRRHDEVDPHARRAEALLRPYVGLRTGPVRVNDRWVGPEKRLDYLAAADAGLLGQHNHLETRFSFRTRLIDCLQAGLPVVSMRGDELSETAAAEGWGLVSDPGDLDGMTQNVLRLAREDALRRSMATRARSSATELSWQKTAAPLVRAIDNLGRPDRVERLRRAGRLAPGLPRAVMPAARVAWRWVER